MRSDFGDFFRGLPRSERNLQVEEIIMRTNSGRTTSSRVKSNRANSRRAVLSLAGLIALHWFSLASGQETESKTPAKNPTGVSLGEAKLAGDGFKFTEGPTVDPEGNVYFTDQPNDRIVLWTVDGKLSDFLKPAGRSNGMYFAPDGKLLACADEANELWELDLSGKHGVLLKEFEGTKFNGPNDVWVDQGGTIYFTDPYYQRPWWDHKKQPQRKQSVYKSDRNGSNLVCVDDALVQPNGIIGDSARRLLYVADIGDRKTYRYKIGRDGELLDRQVFCRQGSDGMTIDSEGNLYLTGSAGVYVYNAEGELIETIAIPKPWTANVCLGGKDRKTLFVTASDSVYTVPVRFAGIGSK
jgi:gluconolactonase